jgi:hypothetical protein
LLGVAILFDIERTIEGENFLVTRFGWLNHPSQAQHSTGKRWFRDVLPEEGMDVGTSLMTVSLEPAGICLYSTVLNLSNHTHSLKWRENTSSRTPYQMAFLLKVYSVKVGNLHANLGRRNSNFVVLGDGYVSGINIFHHGWKSLGDDA